MVRCSTTNLAPEQVVTDLSVLRELAEGLLRYDAVTFLQLLDTLRLSEGRAAVWLLHSAAHTIFDYVRACTPLYESILRPLHILWTGLRSDMHDFHKLCTPCRPSGVYSWSSVARSAVVAKPAASGH
jgi:hypothetical protein